MQMDSATITFHKALIRLARSAISFWEQWLEAKQK